jgi:hypothetical protein
VTTEGFETYTVWPPPGTVVPTNCRIVFHASGDAISYIPALERLHPELVSDKEVIPLRVVSEMPLDFNHEAEAVLEATRRLRPFHRYALRFREAPPRHPGGSFYPETMVRDLLRGGGAWRRMEWMADADADTVRPHWRGVPRVLTAEELARVERDFDLRHFPSCGIFMAMDVDGSDDRENLTVRFEIKEGAVWKRSLTLPVYGRLVAYSGECGWIFAPDLGNRRPRSAFSATVRLTLVDGAGNESVPSGEIELHWCEGC